MASLPNHNAFDSSYDYLDGMNFDTFPFVDSVNGFDPPHWSQMQNMLPHQPQLETAFRLDDSLYFDQPVTPSGFEPPQHAFAPPHQPQTSQAQLTPPNSAIDQPERTDWGSLKRATSDGPATLQPINTAPKPDSTSVTHLHRHGQLTPPGDRSPNLNSTAARKEPKQARAKRAPPAPKQPRASKRSRKQIKVEDEIEDDAAAHEHTSSPASGEDDASAKRRRFLERNRQAAYTCRQRKKEWSRGLEDRYRDLDVRNKSLKADLSSLQQELLYLRRQMVDHSSCDCTGVRDYVSRQAKDLLSDAGSGAVTREVTETPETPVTASVHQVEEDADNLVDQSLITDDKAEDVQTHDEQEQPDDISNDFDEQFLMEAQLRAELARFDEESAEGLGLHMDPLEAADQYMLLDDNA